MRVLVMDGRKRRNSEPLIATTAFPIELRSRLDCYGGSQSNKPSRPETPGWLQQAGFPTMRWSLASDHHEIAELFESWRTDVILLKRSGTFGGESVLLFSRDHVPEIEWNPHKDLFCPEVNPDDGDIYKLEMFGPTLLLGWMSRVPPARSRMSGGVVRGLFGAYGVRDLFDWPETIPRAASTFGEFALNQGYGHVSLDFMRNRDGQFEAIEVNLGNVALWWTTQFPAFRRRYAHAIHRMLVERNGASSTPANAVVRIGNWVSGAVKKPKLLVREIQAARFRRRYTAELEAQHASELRTARRR